MTSPRSKQARTSAARRRAAPWTARLWLQPFFASAPGTGMWARMFSGVSS